MKENKKEAEETRDIVDKVRSEPLIVSDCGLTQKQAAEILQSGGRTLDKTGTPFEGMDAMMNRVMHEVEDAFRIDNSALEEIKRWDFTKEEIAFIKTVKFREPFYLKRIKHITFVKTGDNLLLTAEEYVKRLEGGIIDYDIKCDELKVKISNIIADNFKLKNKTIDLEAVIRKSCTFKGIWASIKKAVSNKLGGNNG